MSLFSDIAYYIDDILEYADCYSEDVIMEMREYNDAPCMQPMTIRFFLAEHDKVRSKKRAMRDKKIKPYEKLKEFKDIEYLEAHAIFNVLTAAYGDFPQIHYGKKAITHQSVLQSGRHILT